MIGIGVTSHNRHSVTKHTLARIKQHMPAGTKLVVVDDASTVEPDFPVDHRFPYNVGIAQAKNKCLALLEGCDHVFLFDDDTYPTNDDWWRAYVESPEAHLMYTFIDFANGKSLGDTVVVHRDSQHVAYSHARGCMLYFSRAALDAVGGFDPSFGKWGWEHINFSDRIHAAGLTTFPYMDVADPKIYSSDEHRTVSTTVAGNERNTCISRNAALYNQRKGSPYFADYRVSGTRDVVLTEYFANIIDVQRNTAWEPREDQIYPLRDSVAAVAPEAEFVVLHNCFDGFGERVEVGSDMSPYWQRWISAYHYLIRNPDIRNVWHVDATDVELLRNPFPVMEPGLIYVGDEASRVGIPWMYNMHPAQFLQQFFRANGNKVLLNCGLIGGSRADVMELFRTMIGVYGQNKHEVGFKRSLTVGETDMGVFNYVVHGSMAHRISHGPHVNTVFKKYQDNGKAWWKHK